MYALQPDFQSWLKYLHADESSDCQMLLGCFSAWVGGRIIGTSEWEMRVVNLLWSGLTVWFMARIGLRLKMVWLPLFLVLQPFFWFYTNEARPYDSQITFGSMILLAFIQFLQSRGEGILWAVTFSIGSVLLCVATMLAPAQIGVTVLVGAIIARKNGWKIERNAFWIMLSGLILLLPLGYYYFETLVRGAKGVQFWSVDFRYLVYIPYEISGSLGLGPSVVHLRELALKGLWQSIPELAIQCALAFVLLALVAIVLLIGIRNRRRDDNKFLLPVFLPFLMEIVVLFIISILIHKAFWPRHYSASFPCYVVALALALKPLLVSSRKITRGVALALLVFSIAADIGIRFGSEHQKEDYRWASSEALREIKQEKNVWWCAAGDAAIYYGVRFNSPTPGEGGIYFLTNNQWNGKFPLDINGIDPGIPDDVIISRPDVHDSNGAVRNLIRDKGYRLKASHGSFQIWVR